MIEAISQEAFDELEAKHGALFECETGQGKVLFRCANVGEIGAFRERAGKSSQLLLAQNELMARATVYPDKTIVEDLQKRFPLFAVDVCDAILTVAKGNEEARAKKP